MIRAALIGQFLLAVTLFFARTVLAVDTLSAKSVTAEIQQRLEQSLVFQPLEYQSQIATALYRVTGNKNYLETATASLFLASDRLQRFSGGLRSAQERKRLVEQEGLSLPASLINEYSDFLYYTFLALPELNRIGQFSMALKGDIGEKYNQQMNGFDFKTGLGNTELISEKAPFLAEQVYCLISLDFGDYRRFFIEAFQKRYPDNQDELLSTAQLHNKWLAMTHLIIAASDQLQEPVNDPLLKWIPDYFLSHASLIFNRASSMILAKIGLTLQLTGNQEQDLLKHIKNRLDDHPVPDNVGITEFWIMLFFGWVEQYYPNPALYLMPQFKDKVPYALKPVE